MLNSPVRSHECIWRVWSTGRWMSRLVCVQHEGQSTESPLKAVLQWFYPERKEVKMISWWRSHWNQWYLNIYIRCPGFNDLFINTTSHFCAHSFKIIFRLTSFGLLCMVTSSLPVSTTCKVLYLTLISYIMTNLHYLSFAFRYKWYIFNQ